MEQLIEKIKLADDLYSVDLRRGGLALAADQEKLLSFQKMESLVTKAGVATHRRILYDMEAKDTYLVEPSRIILPATVKLLEFPHEQFIASTGRPLPQLIALDLVDFMAEGVYGAREIPRQKIFGNEFFVDTMKMELRQVNNQKNTISFEDLSMNQHKIFFDYNLQYKNVPKPADAFSPHNTTAWLPLLRDMDPVVWNRIQKSQVEIDQMLNSTVPLHAHKPRHMDASSPRQHRPGGSH
ncbi:hypothetical protein DCC81_03675 [Chitinophaga parva]|uniref:Uncharacterized protein n=1 Tax=Chitinophaga parva TaxID=2169414 RepID=A0A2T7BLN6_9BACT|nr:hypothetical protein [Chitinophaga parva]PUZ28593.1 hypothetical protein DCC81_03675 [Chitinophaga parva]